jgi:glycosyl transferase family 25
MNLLNKYFEHIFVATYKNSPRLEYIKNIMKDIDYQLFYGFDKTTMTQEYYDEYLSNRKENSHLLSKGMLSCTMTHLLLYKKIYEEKLNNVLILEDDNIIINENLNNLDLIKFAPNYDILYLGLTNVHTNYNNLKPNIGNNIFMMTKNNFVSLEGTNAYVIKQYSLSKKLYDFNIKNLYTADGALMEFLKENNSIYFIFLPQIIIQNEKIETTSL